MEIPGCCCEVSEPSLSVMEGQDVRFFDITEKGMRHLN